MRKSHITQLLEYFLDHIPFYAVCSNAMFEVCVSQELSPELNPKDTFQTLLYHPLLSPVHESMRQPSFTFSQSLYT